MKKTLIFATICFFALVASTAADDWSLQLRWGEGQLFPQSDEWEELYENDDIPRHSVSLDAVLWKGFGPYIGYQGGRTKSLFLNEIDLIFHSDDLIFGGQYRYQLDDYIYPGLRLGLLWARSREVIDDGHMKYKMESEEAGFEIAQDWNIYFGPNAKDRFLRGWGVFFEYYYQYRPLDGMGDLADTSGFGYHIGAQFRFDFQSSPRKRDNAPSVDEIIMKKNELDELIRKRDEAEREESAEIARKEKELEELKRKRDESDNKDSAEPVKPEEKTDEPEAEETFPPSPEREVE